MHGNKNKLQMVKAQDYFALQEAGLPIPIFGVFDASCLSDKTKAGDLRKCVDHILAKGSRLMGVRTEPKETTSPLGNYPHYMPLRTFEEVTAAIARNEQEWPQYQWWYLVNEAFLDYQWNAVVRLTQHGRMPGHWHLDGEVNLKDNVPLRSALDNSRNLTRAQDWIGRDSAQIRRLILKSGLLETWMEISKVRTPNGLRLVFWGLRGRRPRK